MNSAVSHPATVVTQSDRFSLTVFLALAFHAVVILGLTFDLVDPDSTALNTMEITLDDDRTIIHLNGEKVNDYLDMSRTPVRGHSYEPIRGPRPREGYIGVQNHHEPQTVHFKEISVVRNK